MSDRYAAVLYPDQPQPSLVGKESEARAPRSVGNAEAGEALYPPHNEQLAKADDTGRVEAIIRDVGGNVLHRAPQYGDLAAMAARNSDNLNRADLRSMDFSNRTMDRSRMEGANLSGASFKAGSLAFSDLRGADLRGCDLSGVNLMGADLRDVKVDGKTNINGANLDGSKHDAKALQGCSGARNARGLRA